MDEKQIAKLKEAGFEDVVKHVQTIETNLEAEKTGRAEDAKAHEKAIAEKDAVISQKNEDLVNSRRKYKKLEEMTEAEKAELSEKEKELLLRAEEMEAREAENRQKDEERLQKEVSERKEKAIKAIVGDDADLYKKTLDSYGSVVGHDKAVTEGEITEIAQKAFNMLGVAQPDGVRSAINSGGGHKGGSPNGNDGDNGYAESEDGRGLANLMGLNSAKGENKGGNGDAEA